MPPTPPADDPLTTQARAGLRRTRWPALLAGAGGAATLGLLGAAGLAPLLAGLGVGTLATAPVAAWLTGMGMNALAGWVGNLAADGVQAALAEDEPDPAWVAALGQRLDAAAVSDQALATELARLLRTLDALPQALAAIAEEQGAQSDLLRAQYDLLTRVSADMERLHVSGGALGPVVIAEADRVIDAITARSEARFAEVLAALTALRDAQRQALVDFGSGNKFRDVTMGDVAGRDVHKPTLGPGSIYAPGSTIQLPPTPASSLPRSSIPPSFVRPANPFIGHAPQLDAIRARLCDGTTQRLALHGKPGVGKSRLAMELVADPAIRAYFSGGILVAHLGIIAQLDLALRTWIADLGLEDHPKFSMTENLAQITRLIRHDPRPWLVVVDDVWHIDHLRSFFTLPDHVQLLITTRQRDALLSLGAYLAPDALIAIPVLELSSAVTLLRTTAGLPPTGYEAELAILAQLVGGLPLLLTVMGSYVRTQRGEQAEWFTQALVALRAASTRLNLPVATLDTAEARTTKRGWLARLWQRERQPILPLSPNAIIGLSYETLPRLAQRVFVALAGFPPNPVSFDVATASVVVECDEGELAAVLRLLIQRSLIDGDGAGRLRMHQVLWDWAESYDRRAVKEAQQRLRRWHHDLLNPTYGEAFTVWRTHADNWAQMIETWQAAMHDPDVLASCLNTIVPALIAQGYWNAVLEGLKQALAIFRTMPSRQAEIAQVRYYLGLVRYERAEYTVAEQDTTEAYATFQIIHSLRGQGASMSLLGNIHHAVGNYPAALACYQEALSLTPETDEGNYATYLNNLAALYHTQGNYAAARPLYEHALAIREHALGADHPDTAQSLNNLAA
ncbi:tetratricopeptide repeat protein, partial [Candidatus Chloroploca sp. M-50]